MEQDVGILHERQNTSSWERLEHTDLREDIAKAVMRPCRDMSDICELEVVPAFEQPTHDCQCELPVFRTKCTTTEQHLQSSLPIPFASDLFSWQRLGRGINDDRFPYQRLDPTLQLKLHERVACAASRCQRHEDDGAATFMCIRPDKTLSPDSHVVRECLRPILLERTAKAG